MIVRVYVLKFTFMEGFGFRVDDLRVELCLGGGLSISVTFIPQSYRRHRSLNAYICQIDQGAPRRENANLHT